MRKAGLVVFALAAALYASCLPRLYTADDLQYAGTIRTAVTGHPVYHPVGGPPFPAPEQAPDVPVNARYALDWPTSVLAVRVSRSLGRHEEIDAILVTRILFGAAGVAFFFLTSFLVARRMAVAAIATSVLATSSVYWTYSTHLDESIGMMGFTCGALYFLVRRIMLGPSRYDVLAPLLLGVGSLYNLTAVVTAVPAAALWSLGSPHGQGSSRLRSLAGFASLYLGTAVAGVAVALLSTGVGSKIFGTSFWKSSLFVGRPEYGFRPFHDAFDAAASFLRALVAYPPVRGFTTLREYFDAASTGPRAAALLYYGVVALVAVAPLALLLLRTPRERELRRLLGFGGTWFLLASIFAWWWDPTYVKYFLLPVISWCFLLVLALGQAFRVAPRAALAVGGALVAALFVLNLTTIFLPQRSESSNEWLTAARDLRQSQPAALFVSAGQRPLDFYIAYFADRDVVSTGLIEYASGSADVARVLREHLRQHERVGGPIYVYGLDTVAPAKQRAILDLLPGSGLEPAWHFPGLTVYRRTSA